jgi:uncharacterized membrane protein (DUF4010 family)
MSVQEIGVALVVGGFVAWVTAWAGLTAYGLAWLPRDRFGGCVSLLAALLVFVAGMLALTQTPTPGGFQ